jgi:hypothetical protein
MGIGGTRFAFHIMGLKSLKGLKFEEFEEFEVEKL